MPHKSEKIRLQGLQDRRRKLTDTDRQEVRELYGTGNYSLNDLAKQFGVSKKSILLIVNDESAERAKQYRREHWKDFRATKEEHREYIKSTRKYKKQLYEQGKLKPEQE